MTISIAKNSLRTITMAAALSGAAACVSAPQEIASTGSAPEALRGYYAQLERTTDLPRMTTPALDSSRAITRFAFGSCNHQQRSQDAWPVIGSFDPQLFLAIGDNVYADVGYRGAADLATFVDAYRLQASHAEFASFVGAVPTFATWDDHDFGPNDSGGSFFAKEWSETIFENFWASNDRVRSRPGVYDSFTAGPSGQRVQFIILDTRFFRTDLTEYPYQEERRPLGGYAFASNPGDSMLGAEQWRWLEQELAKPADLRIVVSSIQVLTEAHHFESWATMQLERQRLLQMLGNRAASGMILLSGDRHSGAFYRHRPEGMDEEFREFTSSSLNLAFVSDDADAREPDPRRSSSMITEENFGLLDIDWSARRVAMRLMDDEGQEIVGETYSF